MSCQSFILNPYNDTLQRLQKKICHFCKEKEQRNLHLTLEIVKRYYWIDVVQRIAVISPAVKLAQQGISIRIILRGQQTVNIEEIMKFKEILKDIAIVREVELIIDQRNTMNDWSLLELLQGKVIQNLVLKVIQINENGLWWKSDLEGYKIVVKNVKMIIQCEVPIELHKHFIWPEEVILLFDMRHGWNGRNSQLKFISQLNGINRLEIAFSYLMKKEERSEVIQLLSKQLPKIPVISINLLRNKQKSFNILTEQEKGKQNISFSSISEDDLSHQKNKTNIKSCNKSGIDYCKNGKGESQLCCQTEHSQMIMEINHSKDSRDCTGELLKYQQQEDDYLNWEELEGNDIDYSLEINGDSEDSDESEIKKQQRILEEEQEIIKELEEEIILKGLKELENYDNKEKVQEQSVINQNQQNEGQYDVQGEDRQRNRLEIELESNVRHQNMLKQKENIITNTDKAIKEQKQIQKLDLKNERTKQIQNKSEENLKDDKQYIKPNKQDLRIRSQKPARVGKQGGKSLRKGGQFSRRKKHTAKSEDEDYQDDRKMLKKGHSEYRLFQQKNSTIIAIERKERQTYREGCMKAEKQEGEESCSEYSFNEEEHESLSSCNCSCSDSCSCSQYSGNSKNNSKNHKRKNTKKVRTSQNIPFSASDLSERGWQAKQKEEQQLQLTYSPLSTTSSSDSFSSYFKYQTEENQLSEEAFFQSHKELFRSLSKLTMCDSQNNMRLQKIYLKVSYPTLVGVYELLKNEINLDLLVLHIKSEPITQHNKYSLEERQPHHSNQLRTINTLTITEEDQQNQYAHDNSMRESSLVEFLVQFIKSSTLNSLNLNLNSISEGSFTLLIQSLTSYQHLRHLHLHFKYSLQFNNEVLFLLANLKLNSLSCYVNKISQTFFYQLLFNISPQILSGIFLEIESLPTLQLKFFQLTLPFVSISLHQPLTTKSKLLLFHNDSYKIYRNSSNKQPNLFSQCFEHINSVLLSAMVFRKEIQLLLPNTIHTNILNELILIGSLV